MRCGYLYMSWFGFTCNCVLCQMLFFFFCSQKVKANLSDDNVYEFLNLEERRYFELSFYDKNDNLVSASLFL